MIIRRILPLLSLAALLISCTQNQENTFSLASNDSTAALCYSPEDYQVVGIATGMLCSDIERVTGRKPEIMQVSSLEEIPGAAVVAGTVGSSAVIDQLLALGLINADSIRSRWEASITCAVRNPFSGSPLLVIAGSDRRGTAFGLTSICREIGVSPWYWWADVTPSHKDRLTLRIGKERVQAPSVQYRGIFINDERFGGWAQWVEKHFDAQSGKVGPKVYEKVFELLLRLKANYLWPAMHPGTQAFNADPQNAILANAYGIVMGSSHCEQMLRNNEGEWKAVGTYGDFNYITNKKTMQDYWETRVKTNGQYENTYTLGLRGIHDYPMEGANSTAERVKLMQQAIDDQREMLRRNIGKPLEEIPQVLCTYEEVLDAYHSGLQVPEDVIMLWSDDKQGYTRNLCNPQEMKRKGGAGIYYHLSYHGDPESWIWLSPLSPAFISTELTKAYTHGAQKIWVFNVGDIKPAEKEISFAMDLAWDINEWTPDNAHTYIQKWAQETFGKRYAKEIASIQDSYYKLMAAGKDSHVWYVEYTLSEIQQRLQEFRSISKRAEALAGKMPSHLQSAFFELILYPVKGAWLLNEYQLQSRLSQVYATMGQEQESLDASAIAIQCYDSLNAWTERYNNDLLDGKWRHFFNWRPYHWYYSSEMDAPVTTPALLHSLRLSPSAALIPGSALLSGSPSAASHCASAPHTALSGSSLSAATPSSYHVHIESTVDGYSDLWIKALTPVRNFSKAASDNRFCTIQCADGSSFEASATPTNNVWHSPLIGPMWSKVGRIHLHEGDNIMHITDLDPQARIEALFVGNYPFLPAEPLSRIPAGSFTHKHAASYPALSSATTALPPCTSANSTPAPSCNIQLAEPHTIKQLGYCDGVTVEPFDTPSFEIDNAPYTEYLVNIPEGAIRLEVRTLPTLHIYEGRDARYAVQIDDLPAQVFSIHEGDFTSEWRLNVLRGYATRSVALDASITGTHRIRIYFLDPGIVLQELLVH